MAQINDTVSPRGVLSLVFAVLAITGWCPCLGSVAAIVLGMGESSAVGRAGFFLGWISLFLLAFALVLGLVFVAGAVVLQAFH